MIDLQIYTSKPDKVLGLNQDLFIKKQAILLISNNVNHSLEALDSNIFNSIKFSRYYKPRIYKTINSKKRYMYTPETNYKELAKSVTYKYKTKNALKGYNQYNIIDDLTERWITEVSSIANPTIDKLTETFYSLISREISQLKEVGYEDFLFYLPIEAGYKLLQYKKIRQTHFPIAILLKSVSKGDLDNLSKLQDTTLLFINNQNQFLKLTLSADKLDPENIKKISSRLTTRFKRIYDKSILPGLDQDSGGQGPNPSESHSATEPKSTSQAAGSKEPVQATNEEETLKKTDKVSQKIAEVQGTIHDLGISIDDQGQPLDKDLDAQLEKDLADLLATDKTLTKLSTRDLLNQVRSNPKIKSIINQYKTIRLVGKSNAQETKASSFLLNKQNSIVPPEQVLEDHAEVGPIDAKVADDVDITFDETKTESKMRSFDRSYYDKLYDKDMMNVLTGFSSDPDVPLYLTSFKKTAEHTDKLNKLDTYHLTYRDTKSQTHTVTIDVPKIIDDKYIYLNGSKKIITKQITSKPVVKIKPDEVYINTNYNKISLKRFGSKLAEQDTVLRKTLLDPDFNQQVKPNHYFRVTRGSSEDTNSRYLINLEYNSFSTYVYSLDTSDMTLVFNQESLRKEIDASDSLSKIEYDTEKYFPVGYNGSRLIVVNIADNKVYYKGARKDSYELFADTLTDGILEQLEKFTGISLGTLSSKNNPSLAYTRVKLLGKNVPLFVLIGYEKGITTMMDMYNIKYSFDKKNTRTSLGDQTTKVKFKNGYLYYDSSKLAVRLLMSALHILSPDEYDFNEFNSKLPYLDFFDEQFGTKTVGRGFHNTITFLIDPITKDVLSYLGLPTDIYDLLLYANNMLEDLSFKQPNDLNTYRLRTTEQVPALMYNILSQAYGQYKRTAAGNNPQKLSVPRNILVKKMTELQTVEEASDLNPPLTIENEGKVSYKGLLGQNNDETYTPAIRAFSETAKGQFASGTPDSVIAHLTKELVI